MNHDLEKIRVACLELMGWKVTKHYDPPRWWSPADPPEANTRTIDDLPDPTRSLDDVLPLMRRYEISLFCARDGRWGASKPCCRTAAESFFDSDYEEEIADNPALAVCQMALRCAGRILADFEASP